MNNERTIIKEDYEWMKSCISIYDETIFKQLYSIGEVESKTEPIRENISSATPQIINFNAIIDKDGKTQNIQEILWLKSFFTSEKIIIDKETKSIINKRYQALLSFLKCNTKMYIKLYQIQNNLQSEGDVESKTKELKSNNFILKCILYRKRGIDMFSVEEGDEEKKHMSIENQIPFVLNPEFVFDRFIYHRNSMKIGEEEIIQAKELIDIFELFYYSTMNHLQVMVSRFMFL